MLTTEPKFCPTSVESTGKYGPCSQSVTKSNPSIESYLCADGRTCVYGSSIPRYLSLGPDISQIPIPRTGEIEKN